MKHPCTIPLIAVAMLATASLFAEDAAKNAAPASAIQAAELTADFVKQADGSSRKVEMVPTYDGIKLRLSRDLPAGKPRAVLVISHGLASHLGFFDGFSAEATAAGIAIYRFDHRGHGASEGKRGYAKSYWEMVGDVKEIVALAKREQPGLPVFVLGHSMGGHIAALYATKYPDEVRGVILAAGVLRYHRMNFGWLPRPEDPESYIDSMEAAHNTLHLPGGSNGKSLGGKPDPLMLTEISISIINAFKEGLEYLRDHCRTFAPSVLVLNGNADLYVDPQDAIDFYQETGAKDRSLRIYDGIGHYLMAEPAGDMISGDIINWILHRL